MIDVTCTEQQTPVNPMVTFAPKHGRSKAELFGLTLKISFQPGGKIGDPSVTFTLSRGLMIRAGFRPGDQVVVRFDGVVVFIEAPDEGQPGYKLNAGVKSGRPKDYIDQAHIRISQPEAVTCFKSAVGSNGGIFNAKCRLAGVVQANTHDRVRGDDQ